VSLNFANRLKVTHHHHHHLHWLRIQERIQYKQCVIVFKCQHSLAPPYLSDQLQQVARIEPRQRMRSSSSPALVVPATRRSSLGYRPSVSCRCRQGVEQSAVNSHCCVKPGFIPSSPENSPIHRMFSTILVTLSAFWANVTCFDYVGWPCSLLTLRHSKLFFFYITLHHRHRRFLPRDAMHKRGLCRHAVSVCLSFSLESPIHAPKFQFLGAFTRKI